MLLRGNLRWLSNHDVEPDTFMCRVKIDLLDDVEAHLGVDDPVDRVRAFKIAGSPFSISLEIGQCVLTETLSIRRTSFVTWSINFLAYPFPLLPFFVPM